MQNKKYPEILKTPIVKYSPELLDSALEKLLEWSGGNGEEPDFDALLQENVQKQEDKRWAALYKHFGISHKDENSEKKLLHALVREKFTGFSIVSSEPPKPGNRKWRGIKGFKLYADIRQFKAKNENLSDSAAYSHFAGKQGYKGMTPAELKARLSEIKRYHGKALESLNPIVDHWLENEKCNPFDTVTGIEEKQTLNPKEFSEMFFNILKIQRRLKKLAA